MLGEAINERGGPLRCESAQYWTICCVEAEAGSHPGGNSHNKQQVTTMLKNKILILGFWYSLLLMDKLLGSNNAVDVDGVMSSPGSFFARPRKGHCGEPLKPQAR